MAVRRARVRRKNTYVLRSRVLILSCFTEQSRAASVPKLKPFILREGFAIWSTYGRHLLNPSAFTLDAIALLAAIC